MSDRTHIGALDGLRGIACMLIFAGHFLGQNARQVPHALITTFSQYWSGVDLFFVLSGFVIFLSLDRLRNRGISGSALLKYYLTSRSFRIIPTYALFLSIYFLIPQIDPPLSRSALFITSIPGYVYLFFGQSWYMAFHERAGAEFVDASWSLCAEVFLYILSFLIICLASNRSRVRFMIALAALSILTRVYVVLFTGDLLTAYLLPVCRMDGFLIGGMIALFYGNWTLPPKVSSGLNSVLILFLCLFVVLSIAAHHFASAFSVLFSYTFYAIFFAAIVFKLLNREVRILSQGPLRYIGTVSYFIYLFHFPIIYCISNLSARHHFHVLLNLLITLSLTVCAATISWYAMEKPLINLGTSLNLKSVRS